MDPNAVARTQHDNKMLVKQGRNSNFTMSQSVRPAKMGEMGTSAGDAYTPEKLAFKEQAKVGNV